MGLGDKLKKYREESKLTQKILQEYWKLSQEQFLNMNLKC